MELPVTRLDATALRIAACHDLATRADLPAEIRRAVDATLASLRGSGTPFNRCIRLYRDHDGETPLIVARAARDRTGRSTIIRARASRPARTCSTCSPEPPAPRAARAAP